MNQNSSRTTELTPGLLRETDTENILKDWSSNFEVCFPISAAELKKRIFDRPDRCPEASLCVRDAEGKVQGCIVTKISDQQELYPDTAWITLLYVNPAYRKKGYGRLLYQQAQEVMSKKNVHTIGKRHTSGKASKGHQTDNEAIQTLGTRKQLKHKGLTKLFWLFNNQPSSRFTYDTNTLCRSHTG